MIFQAADLTNILGSLGVFVVSVALAWFFVIFLVRTVHRLAKNTRTDFDDHLISSLRIPIIALVIILGFYLASLLLPLQSTLQYYLHKGISLALSLLAVYSGVTLIYVLSGWYRREVLGTAEGVAIRFLRVFQGMAILAGGLAALVIVMEVLGFEATAVKNWVGEVGWKIALVVILSVPAVLSVSRLVPKLVIAGVIRRTGESEEEVKKRVDTLSRVLANVGQVAILVMAGFMVLSILEIDIAPILAGVGVFGIAIGFGAQSLIKDLLAGVFIILESQYHVGDVVKIADVSGQVEDINLRRTILRDLDGIVHFVPNGEIRVASNFTREWSRVNLNISVAYKEDLDRVISVINRVGTELANDPEWQPLIIKPPQALRVDNLGDSGIEIKILGDTKPIRQWDVMGELRKRLKKAFDEEGIEIPWPHTKVYFGNAPPNDTTKRAD